ncbi:MAG: GNAT family N-acetyltransferase [Anaerosacchariphilus sp.]
MTLADLPALNALCRENGYDEMGEEEAKAYIKYMYGLYQCGMWVVLEKESGRIIGRAGFGIADYLPEAELDLGYLIDTPYRRQGYGEEACRAALDYGRDWLELPDQCLRRGGKHGILPFAGKTWIQAGAGVFL